MKDYRETMKDLSFTREQKEAMVDRLLAEQPQAVTRRPKKKLLAAVAALLALTITACAAGGFQALAQVVAQIIDPNSDQTQAQTIEDLFSPVGVSDTDNGVTITAEGVIGDIHSVSVLYSIRRDNGEPLIPPSEETARVSNGDNFLCFEHNTGHQVLPFAEYDSLSGLSAYGNSTFLDFDVSDSTLYFLESWTYPQAVIQPGETITAQFVNLYSQEMYATLSGEWIENQIPLVQGTWELTFDLNYEPAAITLPTGQTFHYKEITGTITELRISPLSIHLEYDYTVDMEALTAEYDPETVIPQDITKENWLQNQLQSLLYETALDSLKLNIAGDDISPLEMIADGDYTMDHHAIISDTFEEIHPLDTIESITIGDLTIPVESP